MSTERGSLFELGELNVDDFDVKTSKTDTQHHHGKEPTNKTHEPTPADIRKLAAETGFTPRTTRRGRKRTGRTEQLNIKTTATAVQEFYSLADENDWMLGEVLEHALAALRRELTAKNH